MSVRPSLWPEDIAVTDVVAPVVILKEQASLLGQRTQNLVEARVHPGQARYSEYPFVYYFELVAPALDNYRYRLFEISHGVEFCPVRIEFEEFDESYHDAISENEFMAELAKIFSSERTKRIVSSLIAQSKA
jgi:hypothetical protein